MTEKRNIGKAGKVAMWIVAVVVGLPLLFFLVCYLAAPTYDFYEPKPFAGAYWNNPYSNMNPDDWKQCNFHTHSRAWGGLTNGRHNSDSVVKDVYSKLNFDHVSISNYMKINEFGVEESCFIPCYEHGYGIFKTHQLCIGAQKVWMIDYPFSQNISMKQNMIYNLQKDSRLVALAHPVFGGGYKVREMMYLSDYRLLEVLNPYGISLEHWDVALSNGHRVYILADDDSHDASNPNLVGRRFTMVNTPEINTEAVCSALENGNAYGVDFNFIYDEPLDDKCWRIKQLPVLTRAELVADTFFVAASEHIKTLTFTGRNGKLLKTSNGIDDQFYVLADADTYVRTEIEFGDGTKFYLNPLTRHFNSQMTEKSLAHFNGARTWMMRVAYIMIVVFVVYMIKKPAQLVENESDKR